MKKLFSVFICLYLIQSIKSECFNENPSGVSTCEGAKSGSTYCCYVEYRTDLDANYKRLCIPVIKDDIKDGKFEETIGTIEGGNYTGSGWNETILSKFKNYASIAEFDCKGNYLYQVMFLFILLLFVF